NAGDSRSRETAARVQLAHRTGGTHAGSRRDTFGGDGGTRPYRTAPRCERGIPGSKRRAPSAAHRVQPESRYLLLAIGPGVPGRVPAHLRTQGQGRTPNAYRSSTETISFTAAKVCKLMKPRNEAKCAPSSSYSGFVGS